MKRFNIILTVMLLAGLFTATAQNNSLDKVFLKYKDTEGFESVIINKDLFEMMQSMKMSSDNKMNIFLEGIETIKILTYKPKADKGKRVDLYSEVTSMAEVKDFKELLSVNEEDSKVIFLVKNNDKGRIQEFLMVTTESNESTIIWIKGNIDLSMLSRLSKGGFNFNMFNESKKKEK
jgi:metallophosphoesterase superfamily enzyme